MTIKELAVMARFGELRNMGLGDSAEETILSYINLGMLELYKRFRLSTKEYIVTLITAQTEYTLPDDCMWLMVAYGEVAATLDATYVELPINNESSLIGINTIGWNKIQVPSTITGAYVSLIYAAAPVLLNYNRTATTIAGVAVPADSYWSYVNGVATVVSTLELPMQFIEPLLHYMGYRSYGAMNGNVDAENSTHYTRFEASCKRIEQAGMMTTDSLDIDSQLFNKGFA